MVKLHIITIAGILFATVNIAVSSVLSINNRNNIVDAYIINQNNFLDYIKKGFEDLPEKDTENPEILNKVFKLNQSYGFVYRDNIVVYEKDIETTKKYKDSTTRELFNDYSLNSGKIIVDNMADIIFKDKGSEILTKNNEFGKEIITWVTLKKNNKNYYIGISCPAETVLKNANYYINRNTQMIIAIVNSAIIILCCVYICSLNRKMTA